MNDEEVAFATLLFFQDGPGSRCIYAKMRLILSDVEDTFCNGWMPELPTQRLDKYPRFEKVGQPREFNCKGLSHGLFS